MSTVQTTFFWSRDLRDLISEGSKTGLKVCAEAAEPQGNHADFFMGIDDIASIPKRNDKSYRWRNPAPRSFA